ncbi:MAG TPA: type II toxin-antitoxin system RelE/ParE family toxin [Pyrinomonadaceae bacterium]|nr:type II toxin-antitoxin system RelE/ParE family toxin [Pyrinomonadaceae bacterium]
MREIVFYKTESGSSPVEEFLDSLTGKQAQKATWVLRLVEELDSVPTQYFKKLTGTDDIWEVRMQMGGDIIRLLGFFYGSRFIVLTNGFAKKTRKTPRKEIALAEQRKREYLNRSKK